MAFPSNIGSKQQSLDVVWGQIRTQVTNIKQYATTIRTTMAGGTTANEMLNFISYLVSRQIELNGLVVVPGIAAYAQAQISNPSLNITTEYQAMSTAITNVVGWIKTNFPANGGFIQPASFGADGHIIYRSFDAASLAPLVVLIDALLATID